MTRPTGDLEPMYHAVVEDLGWDPENPDRSQPDEGEEKPQG